MYVGSYMHIPPIPRSLTLLSRGPSNKIVLICESVGLYLETSGQTDSRKLANCESAVH